jgi:Icc-related predicted phosphoesterase
VSSIFGVLGDIHGNFAALDRVLRRHPEVPFWLCVGDIADDEGGYPAPAAPVYWVKGNNEDFGRIAGFEAGTDNIDNLYYLQNGRSVQVEGLTVAGVGGTFAPTWYDTPAAALPVKGKDDKRRHFVREEIDAARALGRVDVLLTHEAPQPFWIDLHPPARSPRRAGPDPKSSSTPSRRWRRDVGKAPITELADALQPRLHCFGHHHVFASFTRSGIPTICVDRINRGYLVVDARSFEWQAHSTDA